MEEVLSQSHNYHRPITNHCHKISTLHLLVHLPWNSDSLHVHLIISTHYKETLILHSLVWSLPYQH